jgi:tol-pal system protein YbgF
MWPVMRTRSAGVSRTQSACARLALAIVFLCPLAAPAQSTRSMVEDLGLRVERLEQTVQGQALLELLQRIETLSALSREQRGELDLLRRELETLRQQQRDVMVDQERRLAMIEQALTEIRARAATSPVAADEGAAEVAASMAAQAGVAPSMGAQASVAPSTVAGEIAPVVNESPEALYARALASLNAGEYPTAIAAFEVFMQRHPTHPLINNARYWMGQAYFLLRDYSKALEFFAQVGPDMADIGKVADAGLKRGLCEIELGRNEAARQSLETVASRYPDSAAAPLARQALARLPGSGSQ